MLEQIVASTRRRVAESKRGKTLAELERLVSYCQPSYNFEHALQGEGVKLIAEIKRASPSKGWLNQNINVFELVHAYKKGGAAAISVLTEPEFFHGSFADLALARKATNLPLLCKDFILEPCQIYEARLYGADAVLLIAAILSLEELTNLIKIAHDLGMSALVEVHNESEVEKALAAKASLIGINNRNLKDFSVDLEITFRLRPLLPPNITIVSESGIKSHKDILRLQTIGINAVLIGEALVTSPYPEAKIKELMQSRGLEKPFFSFSSEDILW